ncbi:hypothetical protein QJQ45_018666 [Haematococcus lacustris]|nr:hypothetical protein QJQ45_018666 [Haematococcus lacustris]
MSPKRNCKRPVSPAPSAAGASGSGQQVQGQGQGQAAKVVIAERRQVIKAGLRGLVKAALPDLSPAQVDAIVAEINKRMTMGSKQCCLAAVLCLSVLLASFLGQPSPAQPTQDFPAAGPAPGPPPPPDPACPPYAHPRVATRTSPRTAVAPAAPDHVVNGMKWVSRQHYHQERGVAVFLGAGCFSQGGWKANAVREGFRRVVEQPSRPSADPRPDRLVIVDEFRTTRVSSSVHARQPCELHLPNDRPRPADWVPPAGQVNQRLVHPAKSQRHAKYVRDLLWCHEAPPWGRYRDINGCLKFQRIGESMQRPLELCSWMDRESLPVSGEEYQQGYKLKSTLEAPPPPAQPPFAEPDSMPAPQGPHAAGGLDWDTSP